ncbi:MAG: hypothetical protein WBA87_14630 [Microbacterium sp.]
MTEPVSLGLAQIEQLIADSDPWLSCDDCFEQIDWVIERSLHGSIPLPEPFRVHLTTCAVCHEEARSLAALIAPEFSMTIDNAIAHLDGAIRTVG